MMRKVATLARAWGNGKERPTFWRAWLRDTTCRSLRLRWRLLIIHRTSRFATEGADVFFADLHIHSKFSRATAKDANLDEKATP